MADIELTYAEAASKLGCSVDKLRRMVRDGEIQTNGKEGRGKRVLMDIESPAVMASGASAWSATGLFAALEQISQVAEEVSEAMAEALRHNEAAWSALQRAAQARARLSDMVRTPPAREASKPKVVA